MKEVLNRIPTKPNRKLIIYEDGRQEYAIIEYADEPTQDGTRIDRGLFQSIAGDIYRIDKYTEPTYLEEAGSLVEKQGIYIPLWGKSHYTKCGMIVSASSESGTNYAYNAMNGVDGYWESNSVPTVATPAILTIQLHEPIAIRQFTISGYNSSLYCKKFAIYGSTDGDNWYEVKNIQNNTASLNSYDVTGNSLYKYYQLRITEAADVSSHAAILEFNITSWLEQEKYNKISLAGIPLTEYIDRQRLLLTISDNATTEFNENIIPPMHNIAHKGFLVQSSGSLTGTSATDAFDYDVENTYWASTATETNRYLQVTCPINIRPTDITLKIANVLNGKIEASSDGESWETLIDGISTANGTTTEVKNLVIETENKYTYFKFSCVAYTENISTLVYEFAITNGYKGIFNYNNETTIDINTLGNRKLTANSITEDGNYEFVYDSKTLTYTAFLNSFSRENVENTFTEAEKIKLAGIEEHADANVIEVIKVNGIAIPVSAGRIVELQGIEKTTNRDTTISSTATDETYPSSKAVKNYVDENLPDTDDFATREDLEGKVDKRDGYSLMSNDEILRLSSVQNYDDTALRNAIAECATEQYVDTAINIAITGAIGGAY